MIIVGKLISVKAKNHKKKLKHDLKKKHALF